MCYAIPGKAMKVNGKIVTIDYFGENRTAIALDVIPKQGEYVYAQGGVIVKIVPEREALESLKAWENVFEELKKIDEQTAKTSETKFTGEIKKAIHKANNGIPLSEKEILKLLETTEENTELLCNAANAARQKQQGNACCVHAIIEFSNNCKNNCSYCGIRRGNAELKRYRMSVEEIIERADYAVNTLGFKALTLQSGEDAYYDEEKLLWIVKGIKAKCGALIMLSIGEAVSIETYEKLFKAGAHAALLRFETSNKKLYEQMHQTSFETRIKYLKELRRIGFLVATGALVGLPGQTNEDAARDIALARELEPDVHSFGPFIPHVQTPLADNGKPSLQQTLRTIATIRLSTPNAKILATTALETLAFNAREKALTSGASSLMLDATPEKYRSLYDLYPGKTTAHAKIEEEVIKTIKLLKKLGRAPTDLG